MVAVHWKSPVTRTLPEESVAVERPASELVPHACFTIGIFMRLPEPSSFARKISKFPILVKELPKILLPVHSKNHVTKTLPEESVAVEVALSLLVPHACLTQRGLPAGSSFARKISATPPLLMTLAILVKELPKILVPVH